MALMRDAGASTATTGTSAPASDIPPCPLVHSTFAHMSAVQFLSEYGVLIDKLVTLPLEAPITDAIQVLEAQGISSVPVTRSEV